MKNKWFLVGVMLLLISLLATSCGIPQEDYDAVVAERDAAQAQVASLQSQVGSLDSDLAKAESQVGGLESDLAKAESQVDTLQSEYNAFKSDVGGAWTSLDGLLAINTITLYISSNLLLDDLDEVYQGCLLMTAALASLDDSALDALWQEAYVSNGGQWNVYYTPFDSFMESLAERIDSEQEALNNKL